MALSSVDRVRLENLLGLLGSDFPGERENAARLIEQFRKQRGLSWSDLLVRGGLAGQPSHEGWRVLRPTPPRAPHHRMHDAAWRWSTLIGFFLVGVVTLTSAIDIRAIRQGAFTAPASEQGDVIRVDRSALVAERPPATTTLPTSPVGAKGEASAAFAQGVADRKMWGNWRKSDAPRLCAGHLRNDQAELKSACATAARLLKKFDQRRRTDREYLRGWNSVTSDPTPVSHPVMARVLG
jgi:hypothetical protein